jgi:hypothetical protein
MIDYVSDILGLKKQRSRDREMALVFLACFIFVFAAIYLLGKWILGPIDRAAKDRHGSTRISIGDLLCLFIAVQVPLSFISTLQSEETETHFLVFTILTWLVAPIIWIVCAMNLSRAGIPMASIASCSWVWCCRSPTTA